MLVLFAIFASYLSSKIQASSKSILISFFIPSFVFIIPLVSHSATTIETANYGFLFMTVILLELFVLNRKPDFSLLFFASLGFYFRVTNIVPFFVVLLYLVATPKDSEFKIKTKEALISVLFILPGLSYIALQRLFGSISSGSVSYGNITKNLINYASSLHAALDVPSLVIGFFGIIFLAQRKQNRVFLVIYLIGTITFFLLFNSPDVSKNAKYPLEFFVPFIFCGFTLSCLRVSRVGSRKLSACLLIALILFTCAESSYTRKSREIFKKNYDLHGLTSTYDHLILPGIPINYSGAYSYIKKEKLFPCLNTGPVYSVFPEILSGMKYDDMLTIHKLRSEFLTHQSINHEN
jgi:hypothetical protein